MAVFAIDEVCQATQGVSRQAGYKYIFTSVSTDTRTIKPGSLFVALIGERFDGHDYIEEALNRGATGVVVSRKIPDLPETIVFTVRDTRQALQDLALFHRLRFSIPVIAITGSNGKTTTKDMTAAILAIRFPVLKTEANFNNEIGLPLTLLNLMPEHRAAVVEMGMRGKGEIRELAEIARPTLAVVTNVGENHIERLGSLQDIAEAKSELVEAVAQDGVVVLNGDNPYVRAMHRKTAARTIFFGLNGDADINAENIVSQRDGISFTCRAGQNVFPVHLKVPGRHNVYNALAAIAVGLELGLSPEDINAGLLSFTSGHMRLHVEQRGEYTVINDAYNASPLSMAAAIDTLSDVACGRKIAVLGDMLELGEIAEDAHKALGSRLADRQIDAVVTVGTLAELTAQTAREAGVPVAVNCQDHAAAQVKLREILRPGDTVLIKGSRGMKMETMLEMF